jgi:hypothetical protein
MDEMQSVNVVDQAVKEKIYNLNAALKKGLNSSNNIESNYKNKIFQNRHSFLERNENPISETGKIVSQAQRKCINYTIKKWADHTASHAKNKSLSNII